MLVHGTGVEISRGLKIGGCWGFCCCLFFFSSLQREACLTSEIGGISVQKTLVTPLFLINLVMHHKYVKLCYFDLSSDRKI